VFLKRSGGNIKDCNEQREIAPEKKTKLLKTNHFNHKFLLNKNWRFKNIFYFCTPFGGETFPSGIQTIKSKQLLFFIRIRNQRKQNTNFFIRTYV